MILETVVIIAIVVCYIVQQNSFDAYPIQEHIIMYDYVYNGLQPIPVWALL